MLVPAGAISEHLQSLSDEDNLDAKLVPADAISEHPLSLHDDEDLDAKLAFAGVPVPFTTFLCHTLPFFLGCIDRSS